MSFFDKLKDSNNGIIHKSGTIRKRCDIQLEDFLISDNLRSVRYYFLLLNYYLTGIN